MSFPPAGLGFQSVGLARAIAGLIRLAEACFIRRAFSKFLSASSERTDVVADQPLEFFGHRLRFLCVFGREEPGSHRGNLVLRVLHNKLPQVE